jgi:rRNA processing protein Krr1/Pno1
MGSIPKKSQVARDSGRTKGRRRRRAGRQESTLEIMERLLTRRVSISVSGQVKRVSSSEAIVLQLMQKAMSGNARAWRALLKYQEFANSRSDKPTELRFVESDYTRAVARSPSKGADG